MAFKGNNWIPNLGVKGWGLTIICICFYIFYGFWNGASNTLFGIYENMFGWEETAMSSVMSISGWISLIAIIFFGALCRKIGAKNTSIIGLVLTIIAFALFAINTGSFPLFTVAFVLFFISVTAYGIIGLGALGSSWFPHKKGVFMGFATMGLTICSAAINPIILGATGSVGISGFWWGMAVFTVIVLIAVLAFVHNNPEEAGAYPDNDRSITREQLDAEFKAAQEYKKHSPWTTAKVLKTPQTWLIGIGWGIPMMVGAGSIALFVPTLIMGFGQDPMLGVILLSTMWPVGLLGHYLIGVIDQTIGTKKTTVVVVVIEILACVFLYFGGHSTVCCAVAAGLLMFAISGNANVCMSMTTTVFGREDFEAAWTPIQTIWNVFNFGGVMVMAFLGTTPLGVAGRILLGGILCVIALIPILACSDKQIASKVQEAQD